jgi:sec-independent protein translocase protein TatA
MPSLGPTELIIILVIIIVLFGVGRISKIAGEMGSGIRAFKDGLQGDDKDKKPDEEITKEDSSESKN